MASVKSESNEFVVENSELSKKDGGSAACSNDAVKDADKYEEPIIYPPCLNVGTKYWEVLINADHLHPRHKLRIPSHINGSFRDPETNPNQESITLTLLDFEEDAVDAIWCDIDVEDGEWGKKKCIGRGWHTFVKDCNVKVGDMLSFTMDTNPGNCYVHFLDSDV